MSSIVIKKRVNLDFLGEEYKDAYLTFRSIPLVDLEKVLADMPKTDEEAQNLKIVPIMLGKLKQYFLNGKFPNDDGELEEVTSEDLEGLDTESAIYCFQLWTGQLSDPKSSTPLTSTSTMAEETSQTK